MYLIASFFKRCLARIDLKLFTHCQEFERLRGGETPLLRCGAFHSEVRAGVSMDNVARSYSASTMLDCWPHVEYRWLAN
jgi:hypothetical protein